MDLILTLEGGSGATVERERRVRGGRFTIGRMTDNDWMLPDPERVLSKHHCLIELRGELWYLTDTSSNGVFLGDSSSAIGQGGSVQLRDGERLRIGDYILRVSFAGNQPAPAPARSAAPSPPPAGGGDDLFDSSWFHGKPLESPAHPVRLDRGPAYSRSDHVPVDEVALDLPRRPSPFQMDTSSPLKSAAAPPPKANLPDFDWGLMDEPASTRPATQAPRETSSPAPEPIAPNLAPQPTMAAAAPSGSDARLLQAFLEGAGVSAEASATSDPAALMRELGRRYRLMAGGLIELLLIRGTLKREAGMERTMIAAADNNPLKLTATPDEAVRWLVHPRGPGYLPPEQAIAATVADLKAFMPELVQAMQHALRNLLRRFEPTELEAALADASLLQILAAGGRKAKYWELFRERYGDLAREAESEFLREVGADFVRGRRGSSGEHR